MSELAAKIFNPPQYRIFYKSAGKWYQCNPPNETEALIAKLKLEAVYTRRYVRAEVKHHDSAWKEM